MSFALKLDSPGQPPKSVPLTGDRILLGTLLSNHIVLQGKGIDPIHALIEAYDDGNTEQWIMTDLGSEGGVKLNGKKIEVEAEIRPSDVVEIGSVKLVIETIRDRSTPVSPVFNQSASTKITGTRERSVPAPEQRQVKSSASLFNVREARPRGRVLEVVAYWDRTILEAEYFHKDFKEFDTVTIGSAGKSHFIAANKESGNIKRHVLAKFRGSSGYKLNLLDGMTARIRKGGKVSKLSGRQSVSLGNRDIVHITFGAVNYFLIFVKPPHVILPPARNRDPLFTGLLLLAMLLYFVTIPALWYISASISKVRKDDIWAVVYKPIKKPKPIRKVTIKKKIKKIKDRKILKKPPPPRKTKPVKPAKPTEKAKPKKVKKKPKRPPVVKSIGVQKSGKKSVKPKAPKKTGGRAGIRSSGVGNRSKKGGARAGKSKSSVKGAANVKNKKASGVNLSKLGLDVGQVLSKRGAGARYTDFKSSAGGAGGGRGSRVKTHGLGGLGNEKTLSLPGTKGALNKFGSGQGVLASGGRGSGLGRGFGRGTGQGVSVNIPPGDPVISGGLTAGEISRVIRQNLNQIRHCYEQLLQHQPGITGKIIIKFFIAANGRTNSVKFKRSNISDRSFRKCIVSQVQRWKFPRPRGGSKVTVNYPFVFNPI